MEDVQEHVLCAANWYPKLEFPNQIEGLDAIYWLPQNINKGIVFSGRHHLQCMYQAYQLTGKKQCELIEYQGFLTSHNRWVTRKEAGEIAFLAGQVDKPTDYLFSEHLYYPYPKHKTRSIPKKEDRY